VSSRSTAVEGRTTRPYRLPSARRGASTVGAEQVIPTRTTAGVPRPGARPRGGAPASRYHRRMGDQPIRSYVSADFGARVTAITKATSCRNGAGSRGSSGRRSARRGRGEAPGRLSGSDPAGREGLRFRVGHARSVLEKIGAVVGFLLEVGVEEHGHVPDADPSHRRHAISRRRDDHAVGDEPGGFGVRVRNARRTTPAELLLDLASLTTQGQRSRVDHLAAEDVVGRSRQPGSSRSAPRPAARWNSA